MRYLLLLLFDFFPFILTFAFSVWQQVRFQPCMLLEITLLFCLSTNKDTPFFFKKNKSGSKSGSSPVCLSFAFPSTFLTISSSREASLVLVLYDSLYFALSIHSSHLTTISSSLEASLVLVLYELHYFFIFLRLSPLPSLCSLAARLLLDPKASLLPVLKASPPLARRASPRQVQSLPLASVRFLKISLLVSPLSLILSPFCFVAASSGGSKTASINAASHGASAASNGASAASVCV